MKCSQKEQQEKIDIYCFATFMYLTINATLDFPRISSLGRLYSLKTPLVYAYYRDKEVIT